MDKRAYGLIDSASADFIPLKFVNVNLTICDTVGSVTSTLVYTNEQEHAVDGEFVFPMDDDSAVYQFEVEIDGRKIVGECQEKEQAKSTHNTAKRQGYSSFLLTEVDHAGDIFCMSVGNVPPQRPVKITFSYVVALKVDNTGAVNFVLPVVLKPRYIPMTEAIKTQHQDESVISTPKAFHLVAKIIGQLEVEDVTSEFEGIGWKKEDSGHVEVYLTKEFTFKSDLNLKVSYKSQKASMVITNGNPNLDGLLKHTVAMVNFFPKIDAKALQNASEFIFIVDRSGSMDGSAMKHTKEALLLFLKSLPVGCHFNIISFGDYYTTLFPKSCEYNSDSLKEAMALQEKMQADMGGTEILAPLQHMYKNMKPTKDRPQQVFLLTDGGVFNTREVIEIVRQHNNDTRVFALGIGHGVSTALVRGVARAGKGKAEFVTKSDQLHAKVISCLDLAMQPFVSELKVHWNIPEGSHIINIPDPLPVIFAGEHLVIYAIFDRDMHAASMSVTLSGKIGNSLFNETVISSDSENMCQINDYWVHRLASKTQIKILENADTEKVCPETKKKIIDFSLATNIVSMYTSFVGVDLASNTRVFSKIPQKNTWDDSDDGSCLEYEEYALTAADYEDDDEGSSRSRSASLSSSYSASSIAKKKAKLESLNSTSSSFDGDESHTSDEITQPREKEPAVGGKLSSLISSQSFDGSWRLNTELADVLSLTLEELQSLSPVQDSTVWATALVLVWLQEECINEEKKWKLMHNKAMKWLEMQHIELEPTVQSVLESAKKVLTVA